MQGQNIVLPFTPDHHFMKQIIIGVHSLLDLIFRAEDLNTTSVPATKRLEEGIAGHREVQLSRASEYEREVPVEFSYNRDEYELIVRGRVDGIYRYEESLRIEEIKTTSLNLEALQPHSCYEAQLKLYMYFFSQLYPHKEIKGVLTYFSLKNSFTREFEIEFKKKEFREFFEELADKIIDIAKKEDEWKTCRNVSIEKLNFPFKVLRKGQKELMEKVYSIMEEGKNLLLEAPTGIGKTSAILFPSIKYLPCEYYRKIFFLTAKTPGQNIVRETLELFHKGGLHLRSIFLNAREKMCFCEECICDPLLCEYAKGYYKKVPPAIEEILPGEIFIREKILTLALKYKICPFEFSLDLSLYCDIIVCDYNYVFDPLVYLRRYFLFGGKEKYLFLVDEAHNLVNRGRDMYSASLEKKSILELKRKMKNKDKDLFEFFDLMNRQFIQWNKDMKENDNSLLILNEIPEFYYKWEKEFFESAEEFLKNNISSELRDFYYDFRHFANIRKLISQDFKIFVKRKSGTFLWKIFCINPGEELRKRLRKSHSSIFFSATLSPSEYFKENLGLKEKTDILSLPSPFPPDNSLYLHIPGISTTYKKREDFHDEIGKHIKRIINIRPGNYLCYFPSYKYLEDVYKKMELDYNVEVLLQSRYMSEEERDDFLEKFIPDDRTRIGMVVMGGLFGEGIDLPGDRLIGAIIIGVGLPMVDEEQTLISAYFEDQKTGKGFLYSYMIPGIIRVIQSAGRVLRTPQDRGIVAFMDDRFRMPQYRFLLPARWFTDKRAFATKDYEVILERFWSQERRET
ncbi:MAG TPA: helicase C-terminal domain-containing protein [Candidatus Eremiobacteraeota bacterium]|nr:helicase C-terminal domain-containing protein [Candidatus Eremiobacteraeota bacterium]